VPNYTYTCGRGDRTDRVRPIGTEVIECPACGGAAWRDHVYHIEVIGPTVNTLRLAEGFRDAVAEREAIYQKAEARVGGPIPRPNDWAGPTAKAKAMARRGEIDGDTIRRTTASTVVRKPFGG
jgi:hypothetical protein